MSLLADPETIWTDNATLISIANRKRILLSESPSQSGFRVYCILVVESDGKIQFVDGNNLSDFRSLFVPDFIIGTNSEQGYIGG
jgi:hypothetical protein